MRRRLFILWSVASLVLLTAVCGVWVWSYREAVAVRWRGWRMAAADAARPDGEQVTARLRFGYVAVGRGSFRFEHNFRTALAPADVARDMVSYDSSPTTWSRRPLARADEYGPRFPQRHRFPGSVGFGWEWSRYPAGGQYFGAFPLWAAAVPATVAPAVWAARRLTRRRTCRSGRCPVCGYDLRATPDRCPECGSEPAAPAAA